MGSIARTVDDAALVLSVCAGADARDPFSLLPPLAPFEPGSDRTQLRIAFAPTLGYGVVETEVAETVARAIACLGEVFADIETVDSVCEDEGDLLSAVFIGGLSARLAAHTERAPEDIDPGLLAEISAFRRMSAAAYVELLHRWSAHRERLRRFFDRFDLLLTPTTPVVAWSADLAAPPGHDTPLRWSHFSYPFNLSGQPAATIPCGLSKDGLPVGLQLVVPLGEDARLIECLRIVRRAFESAELAR